MFGGAIAEALAQKAVDNSKDTIILNADIFTNADITRAYHVLKTLPQAALVIPYYPVNPQRAKSFGLLGTQKDKDGNLLLKEFVEKPKYTDSAPPKPDRANFKTDKEFEDYKHNYPKLVANYEKTQTARDEDGAFLANQGMYILSKEASDVLKNMKVLFDGETFQNGKTGEKRLGLGADIMPKIVDLCNKGLLRNDKGEVMKAYTVLLQRPDGQNAYWDDIGSAEAFLKMVKDVATETQKLGTGKKNKFYGVPSFVLEDFSKNTDLKTGVVYQSDSARGNFNNFANKVDLKEMNGNIYVVD